MSALHLVRALRQALAALRDVADSDEAHRVVRALIVQLERELRAEEEAVSGHAYGAAVETLSASSLDSLRGGVVVREFAARPIA